MFSRMPRAVLFPLIAFAVSIAILLFAGDAIAASLGVDNMRHFVAVWLRWTTIVGLPLLIWGYSVDKKRKTQAAQFEKDDRV